MARHCGDSDPFTQRGAPRRCAPTKSSAGDPQQLTLGDLLSSFGIRDFNEVSAIRHTSLPDGLPDVTNATPSAVLACTRDQDAQHGHAPPRRVPWGGGV